MKGFYEVKVARRRGTKYQFTIRRNITVVRGDSGTGKTTLYDMIADFTRLGAESGVTIQCDHPCVALTDIDWKSQLRRYEDSIVFIDEGLKDILSDEFARCVRGSSNYFVIITRADLPSLPYSVDEVYGIKTSGKFHSFVPLYKQRDGYRYSASRALPKVDFDVLLTEDSKSGLQFFSQRFEGTSVHCETACSNSNILSWLDRHLDSHVFVVADGAAFGAFAGRVLQLQDAHRDNVTVCLPESFEWLLLKSGILRSSEVAAALESPEQFVDSKDYMSWEQFFTAVLQGQSRGTAFEYRKSELPEAFALEQNASKVMALIACRNIN